HQAARPDRIVRPVRGAVAQHGDPDGLQACDLDRRAGSRRELPTRRSRNLNAPDKPVSCVLVGVAFSGAARSDDSLDELAALAVSAGLSPVDRITVRRSRPDAALFIGSGKAEEIGARLAESGASLVLFDHELSPIQQRNLSRLWDLPVMDRTELILDIFARRARSHE